MTITVTEAMLSNINDGSHGSQFMHGDTQSETNMYGLSMFIDGLFGDEAEFHPQCIICRMLWIMTPHAQ